MKPLAARLLAILVVLIMSSSAWADNVQTNASVSNQAPTVVEIKVLDDDDAVLPGSQVSPVPGGSRTVDVEARAQDGNGWRDLSSLSLEVRRPDGSLLASVVAQPTSEHSGRTQVYSASFDIAFYEPPGTYTISADTVDGAGSHGTHSDSFSYEELLAFALGSNSITFASGALEPGAVSPTVSVGVTNTGNVALDTQVSGADLAAQGFDASIPADRMKYSSNSTMGGEVALGTTPQTDAAFDLAPGASSSRNAYFDLHVPTGDEQFVPAATYVGSITVGAVASQ